MNDCRLSGAHIVGDDFNLKQKRLHITAESAVSLKAEAHAITLHLIEDDVTTDYLKEKIRYITPEQYEDVVTERAISEICGYPLCYVKLTRQYASQTYIIRRNKVYDITHRKNFCSDICYEASIIIANQVPKVPLYLRRSDKQITNFELYVPDQSCLQGRYGRPVNIKGFVEDESFDSQKFEANESTSDIKEQKESFTLEKKNVEAPCNTYDALKPCCTQPLVSTENNNDNICQGNDNSLNIDEDKNTKTESSMKHDKCMKNKRKNIKKSKSSEINSAQDIIKKVLNDNNEVPSNTKHLDLLLEVEQQIRQWMTFESLRLILGDIYVRGMLEHLGKTWEDYDSTAGLCLGLESKSRYIALCKKLDFMEIEEEICDKSISSHNQSKAASNPVPNFDQLKKDVDEQAIKVKAFFEGKEEFPTTVQDDYLETFNEENEDVKKTESSIKENKPKVKLSRRKITQEKLQNDPDVEFVTLPLIDIYTQTTWRRLIVLEKISKPIASFSCEFGLDEGQIRNLLKSLIASFDFTARNIIFRVTQWDYVALILLKMLTVRYPIISEAMRSVKGSNVIASLLAKTDLDIGYLDRLLTYLTDIVYILSKYHKNNDCSVNNKKCSDTTTEQSSLSNLDQKSSECLLYREKETANSSQFSKSNDFDSHSSKICEKQLNSKEASESLYASKLESKKSIDYDVTEPNRPEEKIIRDDNNSVNLSSNIKDYTVVREIVSIAPELNLDEKMSTKMEELD